MTIRAIQDSDFLAWLPLWQGYNTFYKRTLPDEITNQTWKRFLDPQERMYSLVAEVDGQIVGIVNYLYHRNTAMMNDVCYLQDLFTIEKARGKGVARALILAVYEKAQEAGSTRVYWQTHETNETAMKLYDKVADKSGFIVYRKLI